MRSVVNISLPASLNKIVNEAVSKEHYSSKSEFFRNLLRLWLEGRLFNEIEDSRKELGSGEGKLLKSLKDLR